jgi:hypothetical protein
VPVQRDRKHPTGLRTRAISHASRAQSLTRRSGGRFAPSPSRRSVRTRRGADATPLGMLADCATVAPAQTAFQTGKPPAPHPEAHRPAIKGRAVRGGAQIYVPQEASAKTQRPSVPLTRASRVVRSLRIRILPTLGVMGRAQRHLQQVTLGTWDATSGGRMHESPHTARSSTAPSAGSNGCQGSTGLLGTRSRSRRRR